MASFDTRVERVSLRGQGALAVTVPAESGEELAELFRHYAPYVGAIGLKLLGRDDEVDDLVQDVFIEAHRGLSRLRNHDAAKAWLARITVRRATRRLRLRRLRDFFSLDSLPRETTLIDAAATPEDRMHVTWTYRLLERLPAAQRVVWILKHIEGETLDSIAAMCACSKTTVQRRLRAAETGLHQARQRGGA